MPKNEKADGDDVFENPVSSDAEDPKEVSGDAKKESSTDSEPEEKGGPLQIVKKLDNVGNTLQFDPELDYDPGMNRK